MFKRHYIDEIEYLPSPICGENLAFWRALIFKCQNICHHRSDVKSVIEGLDRSSCILVAHDWGGAVGYYFTAQWPSMVQKFITVNIPHPLSIERAG